MDNSWVKLYRKTLDNGILRDRNAWTIFCWLMLKVDRKTGRKIIGRFWASEELGMKPGTFYDALTRLDTKWKMATLTPNNKFTEVSLTNWHKYQNDNNTPNNKTTTSQQQDNTLQEDKNKELKKDIHSALSYLKNLPEDVTKEFQQKYRATAQQVREKAEGLANYCEGHGKKYKNYRAMLQGALLRDYGLRPLIEMPKIKETPIAPEESVRVTEKMAEFRKSFFTKHNFEAKLPLDKQARKSI